MSYSDWDRFPFTIQSIESEIEDLMKRPEGRECIIFEESNVNTRNQLRTGCNGTDYYIKIFESDESCSSIAQELFENCKNWSFRELHLSYSRGLGLRVQLYGGFFE
jgi:hypothetical protein